MTSDTAAARIASALARELGQQEPRDRIAEAAEQLAKIDASLQDTRIPLSDSPQHIDVINIVVSEVAWKAALVRS